MATIPFPGERRANAQHLEALAEGLVRLSARMTEALETLPLDARLADMAGSRLPDAGARLNHALKLTDEAAHRTLDLVEHSRGLMERLMIAHNDLGAMRAGTLTATPHALGRVQDEMGWCAERLRQNLAEMALAQSYQDLTGQIIRKVVHLVTDVEQALVDLLRNAGLAASAKRPAEAPGELKGPAVPGVDASVSQKDADNLLNDLGL